MKMNAMMLGAILLLVGGLINTIPPLGTSLAGMFNGTPVIQMIVGATSIIVGLVIFFRKSLAA